VLRRGRVIQLEGMVDSLDGDLLRRTLERMTRDLPTSDVLVLDLRQVDSLTPGAFGALVEGTLAFRDSGGRVRCALPETDVGRLLVTTGTRNTVGFEVEQAP
jgi:anti-anti-sigma regulatory factor